MSDWTRYLHTTVAALTIAVALYYRVPQLKRKSFEEKFPRVAALIGMIAGIIPFLPMILDNAKRLVTPPHATPVVAHNDTPVPQAPWSESSDVPPNAKE